MDYLKKNKRGFTLIELLVVIAIVGVLSGVVLQSLKGARQKSQNATRLSDIDQINKALELYFTKQSTGVGSFPTTVGGTWNCINSITPSPACWAGTILAQTGAQTTAATNINLALAPNISKIPKDPQFVGSVGDYYLYNPSFSGADAYMGTGAYLRWVAFATSLTDTKPCGRGKVMTSVGWDSTSKTNNCLLYLGK